MIVCILFAVFLLVLVLLSLKSLIDHDSHETEVMRKISVRDDKIRIISTNTKYDDND